MPILSVLLSSYFAKLDFKWWNQPPSLWCHTFHTHIQCISVACDRLCQPIMELRACLVAESSSEVVTRIEAGKRRLPQFWGEKTSCSLRCVGGHLGRYCLFENDSELNIMKLALQICLNWHITPLSYNFIVVVSHVVILQNTVSLSKFDLTKCCLYIWYVILLHRNLYLHLCHSTQYFWEIFR